MKQILFILSLFIVSHAKGQYVGARTYEAAAGCSGTATWDNSNKGTTFTLSVSNTTATAAGGTTGEVRSTTSFSSTATNLAVYIKPAAGFPFAWSGPCFNTQVSDGVFGIDNGSGNVNQFTGQNVNTYGMYSNNNNTGGAGVFNSASLSIGSGFTCGYNIGDEMAFVINANTIQYYRLISGTWTTQGAAIPIPAGTYYVAAGTGSHTITWVEMFCGSSTQPSSLIAGTTQY